jgi:hypothetical protein
MHNKRHFGNIIIKKINTERKKEGKKSHSNMKKKTLHTFISNHLSFSFFIHFE